MKGYNVYDFSTVDQVKKILGSSKDTIFVFLLDYSFEKRSGENLARQIKEKSPKSKIIMTSGYPFSKLDSVKRLLDEKIIDAFLEKPFSFPDLENILLKI